MVNISCFSQKAWLEICVMFFRDGVEGNDEECKLFLDFVPCK